MNLFESEQQRRRKQWRESQRKSRGWYKDDLTEEQRKEMDKKSRQRNAESWKNLSEEKGSKFG